jgi:hypothetical protein
MEEMETEADAMQTDDRPGTGSGESPRQCLQWPRPVVEFRGVAHEPSPAHLLLPPARIDSIDRGSKELADCAPGSIVWLNRRDTERYVRWCGRTVEFTPHLLPDW